MTDLVLIVAIAAAVVFMAIVAVDALGRHWERCAERRACGCTVCDACRDWEAS